MNIRAGRAVLAGIGGTIAMTAVGVWVVPLMGMPAINPANMLADAMGGMLLLGWIGHFMIGAVLALIYSTVASKLPGSPPVGGALYGIAPWLLAQIVMMPMMGMGLFSGSMVMAGGGLIGHLVYGAVVGAIYGPAIGLETAAAGASSA